MKPKQKLDQPLRWKELLPLFFCIGLVPLLFRLSKHAYTLSEQVLYPGKGFNDLYSLVKAQTLTALTAVALVVFLYHIKAKRIHFERSVYTIGAGIYAVAILLSSFLSEYDIATSGLTDRFEGMWVLLSYVVLFVIALHYGRQEKASDWLANVFLASSMLVGLFGLMQYVGYDPYTAGFLRYFAFPREVWDTVADTVKTSFQSGVVSSLYNPNFMGSYAAMASLLSLGMLLKETASKKMRIFYLMANLMAIAALVGSRSSAGFVGFSGGLILMVLFAPKQFKVQGKKLLALLVAWAGIVTVMSMIYSRMWKGARLVQQDYLTLLVYAAFFLIMAVIYLQIFQRRDKNKVLLLITLVYGAATFMLAGLLFTPIQNATATFYYGKGIEEVESGRYREERLKSLAITQDQIQIEEEDGRSIRFQIKEGKLQALDGEGNNLGLDAKEAGHFKVAAEGYEDYELVMTKINDMPDQFIYANVPKYDIWAVVTDQGLQYKGRNHLPAAIDHPAYAGFKGREKFMSGRGYIWSRTFPLVKDHLILGAGPDAFVFEFPQYEHIVKWNSKTPTYLLYDKPHNWYLQMAINTGLVSMLAVLVMGVWLLIQGIKKFMLEGEAYSSQIPLVALVMGYAFAGIFNDSIVSVAPVFWVLFGLAAAKRIKLNHQA